MANQFVPITAGTGTKIQVFENTVGGNLVEAQAVSLVDATGLTIVASKGSQGTSALAVQSLRDSGRNVSTLFMAIPIVTTATDTLMSLTGYKSGAAVGATITPAVVTAGKTLRITSIVLSYVAIATAGTAQFTLRANAGGVVAITSPAVSSWFIGAAAATAGAAAIETIALSEGLEFAAGTGIGVSMVGRGATQTAAAVGYGQIAIYGYEY